LLAALPSIAAAQTITFEGLGNGAAIPDGYAGLNWQNMSSLNATSYGPSGYQNGRVSGDMVAYNAFGAPGAVLEASSPFTLNSGWFTAAWQDELTLDMTGYVGDVATYFASNVLDTNGPSFLTFDWMNLSRVTFVTSGGVPSQYFSGTGAEHFAVDDLTVNAEVTATPEPASVVLLATGLLGVGVVTRRRRKRSLTA
jgi:hypothetical protein